MSDQKRKSNDSLRDSQKSKSTPKLRVVNEKETTWRKYIKLGCSIALVLIIFLYVIAAFIQAKATKNAADAAEQAADVASEGLKEQHANAMLDQRAWVNALSVQYPTRIKKINLSLLFR